MKKWIWIGLVVLVLVGGFLWIRSSGGDDTTSNDIIPTDIPVPVTEKDETPELVDFNTDFGNLSTKYPKEWNLVQGEDNDDTLQINTIESTQDVNEFYFCVNLDEYSASNDQDLSMPMIEVVKVESFTVEGIDKSLYLVTFQNKSENASDNDYHWSLTEAQPKVGDVKFAGEIANAEGRRVQVWGRFNCRDDARPDIELNDFNNSRLQTQARVVLTNLSY